MGAGHDRVRWGIIPLALAMGLGSSAHAEGNIQVRFYSAPPPLGWLDGVSVSGHYQTPQGAGPNATLDLSAERNLVTFGVRYSRPRHIFQATGRRSADLPAGRTDTSATLVYTYVPPAPAEGVALTSTTVLYALSASESPSFGYRSHTVSLGSGLRLSRELNASATATATAVQLPVQDVVLWSGSLGGSLAYAKGGTTAYLAPGLSLQNGEARWNVSGGATARLRPDLTTTATASWAAGSLPSASAALTYATGPWQLRTNAATSGTQLAVGVGARLAISERLNVGAGVSLIPATRTPVYSADLSTQAGGLRFGVSASLTAPPDTSPTVSAQASLNGQQRPWQGGLNLSYTRAPNSTSGSATGTLNYAAGAFGAELGLGLNLQSALGAPTNLTGRADLTLNYAVAPRLDVSTSARYERSVAATAPASYRYGVGLRYRFPDKESR